MNEIDYLKLIVKQNREILQHFKKQEQEEKGMTRQELMEKTGWAYSTINKKLTEGIVFKRKNKTVKGGYKYFISKDE